MFFYNITIKYILATHSLSHSTFNKEVTLWFLLRGEVKVEASLKSVEAELARGEVSPGCLGGGLLEVKGRLSLLDRLSEGRLDRLSGDKGGRGGRGKVRGLLVGSVKGVHKGVDSITVGTGWNMTGIGNNSLGSKVGSVLVESEVSVCGVVGVDEGVGVRLCSRLERLSLIVIIVGLLNNRS